MISCLMHNKKCICNYHERGSVMSVGWVLFLITFIDLQVDIEFDLPEVVNMPSLESILNEV